VEINELENEADQIYRRLLQFLFSGEHDPLTVMKLKEIVDQLESAADAFEHVADVVHSIAVKESCGGADVRRRCRTSSSTALGRVVSK
jgi:uncharacterized protein